MTPRNVRFKLCCCKVWTRFQMRKDWALPSCQNVWVHFKNVSLLSISSSFFPSRDSGLCWRKINTIKMVLETTNWFKNYLLDYLRTAIKSFLPVLWHRKDATYTVLMYVGSVFTYVIYIDVYCVCLTSNAKSIIYIAYHYHLPCPLLILVNDNLLRSCTL